MNIGARTAAWVKSGYTAKDYLKFSPFIMLDGIENSGFGVHTSGSAKWVDLCGNLATKDCYFDENSENQKGTLRIDDGSESSLTDYAKSIINGSHDFAYTIVCKGANDGAIRLYGDGYLEFMRKNADHANCFGSRITEGGKFVDIAEYSREYYLPPLLEDGTSMVHITVSFDATERTLASYCLNAANGITSNQKSASNLPSDFGVGKRYLACLASSLSRNLYAIRMYSKKITSEEAMSIYQIDKARFNLPD